jgi:peroxiredoxin
VSVYTLPEDLPLPVDDGACDHLPGRSLPNLTLESSEGPVNLRELGLDLAVLYVYPRTGRPDRPTPDGWDAIPGARGCTPQSCAFRDHAGELAELGAHVAGLSAQTLEDQREFAEREHMPFPVIADPDRRLGAALRLPTFEFDGVELYRRVTLVLEAAHVERFFYPVFPPDRNAGEVVAWLRERRAA